MPLARLEWISFPPLVPDGWYITQQLNFTGTGQLDFAAIEGDVDNNGNGCVNVTDLVTVRINLGNEGSLIQPPGADVDGNGIVNVSDLVAVRVALGDGCQ